MGSSAITLYGYQKDWIMDNSRFLAGMWARQTGKSFASAAKIVLECRRTPRTAWYAISSGERQVKEFMSKIKVHAKITGEIIDLLEKTCQYTNERNEEDSYQVLTATFRNGSSVTALPANPDTVRGYSGNVYFDEFSTLKDSKEMWAAVFPIISRSQYKMMITFTPKGKLNKAWEVWNNDMFKRYKVDIYEAVKQGCPHDIDLLRAAIDDQDLFAQEYELAFLDEATAFLSYDQIIAVQSDLAGQHRLRGSGPFYIGMDIARRRHLSCLWVLESVGDVFWSREVIVLEKKSFAYQNNVLDKLIEKYRPIRACLDQGGMGEKFVEDAKTAHGDYRIEGILFSNVIKNDMANQTKSLFEERKIRIPNDKEVRDDIHSVKKVVTLAGNFRFDVEGSEKSHADRFWALCLAVHASGKSKTAFCFGSEQIRSREEEELYKLTPVDRRGEIVHIKPNAHPRLKNVQNRFKKGILLGISRFFR